MRASTRTMARQPAAAVLIAGAALGLSPVAHATIETSDASASVVIVEPVGAGFSFDILSDAVSAVFLNGGTGDSVSVLMSPRKPGGQIAGRGAGVVVMASGVYRIDLLQPAAAATRLRGPLRATASGPTSGGSSILFLAQFN